MLQKLFFFAFLFLNSLSYAESLSYKYEGKVYEGYFLDAGRSAPTVLLVHDWDGLTDYEIRRATMIHKLGYSVFAVDLFGKGIRPTEDTDKKQHTGELYQDRKKMLGLLQAAMKEAKKHGLNTQKTVAAGYCFGGAAVLELARSGEKLKGFVTFHGGLSTPDGQNYSKTKGKVVVFHGSADTAISMEDFAALAKALEAAKVPHEMQSFGGAPHAFTVFDSPRYNADADKASWERFVTVLKELTE